jgi:hypothetical protein
MRETCGLGHCLPRIFLIDLPSFVVEVASRMRSEA